jgi:hypothetical protein
LSVFLSLCFCFSFPPFSFLFPGVQIQYRKIILYNEYVLLSSVSASLLC